MEYSLDISGRVYPVNASPQDQAGSFLVSVGDDTQRIVAEPVSSSQVRFQVDGRVIDLFFATTPDGTWIWVQGRSRFVQDAAKRKRRVSRRPGETPGSVTPPTPASVVRVLTEAGATVKKGDPLVVVSAMKMEITLSAPYAGIVKAVNTAVAAQVSPGDILVEIEPLPEEKSNE